MRGKITIKSVADLKSVDGRDAYLWDDKIPGFGVKAMPSGGGSYLLKYRAGRGRAYKTRRYHIGRVGDMTPEQARDKARDLREQVRDGVDPMAVLQADPAVTVKTLVADFIKSRRRKGGRSAGETERLLNREIVKPLGDRPAASVTRADIGRVIDAIADRGAGILANRCLAHMKTCFTWAMGRGILAANPILSMEKPAAEPSRDRTPSDTELAEIWNAADQLGGLFGKALQLLVLTGMRRDEVGHLRWSELNLEMGRWTLPASRAKNKQAHIVPLSSASVALLRSIPKIDKQDLIFSTTGKTPISGWSHFKTRLDAKIKETRQATAEAAGPGPAEVKAIQPWRIHDLRRSLATGLADRGIGSHICDMLLHHVAAKKLGVAGVYNKARYQAERRDAIELWGRHIESLLTGCTPVVVPISDNLSGAA